MTSTAIKISPSMMVVDTLRAEQTLTVFQDWGIDLLHVDVMDGVFVPNIMLGTNYIRDLRNASTIPLDLHLMIDEPMDKLDWFDIQPGEWVSVHAEATRHLQRTLAAIRRLGGKARVALNPGTPLSALEWVLDDIDGVLLMTVNPGFAGQKLVPQTIRKIAQLRAFLEERDLGHLDIQVDGNVSIPNAVQMVQAGATNLVLGTSVLFTPGGTLNDELDAVREAITA